MLSYLYKLSILLLLSSSFVHSATPEQKYKQMRGQYDDFLKIHGKRYKSESEYLEHFDIFLKNLQRVRSNYIDENNNRCKMYLTKYSDITTDPDFDYDTCRETSIRRSS